MAKKEQKACRVVWFDAKDQHVPSDKVKAVLTPQSFRSMRTLACMRGEVSFDSGKLGKLKAKSMSAKEQAKVVPARKKPRSRSNGIQQSLDLTKRRK